MVQLFRRKRFGKYWVLALQSFGGGTGRDYGVRGQEPVGPGAEAPFREGCVHSLTCHKISGRERLGRHYYSHFTGKNWRSLHTARIDRVSAEPWGSRILANVPSVHRISSQSWVSLFLACPHFSKACSLPVLSRKGQDPCPYTHTHTLTHSLTHSVTLGLRCLQWSPRRVATHTWIGPKLWGDLTVSYQLFLTCTSSLKSLSL